MNICSGCQINVSDINEYAYMIKHELWVLIHDCPEWQGGLWCIGCLEEKMGRKLDRNDFAWYNGLNGEQYPRSERSERLTDRMSNE